MDSQRVDVTISEGYAPVPPPATAGPGPDTAAARRRNAPQTLDRLTDERRPMQDEQRELNC